MANIISLSTLYGCYYYRPSQIVKADCGSTMREMSTLSNGYQNDHIPLKLNNRDVNISLPNLNAFQAHNIKDRHITSCHLVKYQCKLQHAPDKATFIFERDKKNWTEKEFEQGIWDPRIQLMDAAYKCSHIFAVSIVPKDSSIEQTWYLKKALIHNAYADYCKSCSSETFGDQTSDSTNNEIPKLSDFQGGFIKPFTSYHSTSYRPTIDLDHLPPTVKPEVLINQYDVKDIVNNHYPEQVQSEISEILNCFLEDQHAEAIGLLSFDPHNPHAGSQQRIFFKA